MRSSLLLAVLLLVAAVAHADDLVVTKAGVEPALLLPAIPYWISFEVQNTSNHPVRVPSRYTVELMPPSGEPFLVWQYTGYVMTLPEVYKALPPLAPGETRIIDFPTAEELADGVQHKPSSWQIGKWRVRLILSDELRDDRLEAVPWQKLMGAGFLKAPPLVTPWMEFTIEEPKGIDAAAWKELQAVIAVLYGPKSPQLAPPLWEKFRDSGYGAYLGQLAMRTIFQSRTDDRFERAEALSDEILKRDREGIFTEAASVGRPSQLVVDAPQQDTLEAANAMTSRARAALEEVLKTSKHQLTRLKAEAVMKKLMSPEEMRHRFIAMRKLK